MQKKIENMIYNIAKTMSHLSSSLNILGYSPCVATGAQNLNEHYKRYTLTIPTLHKLVVRLY
jgi:hypothetical protein